MEFCNGHGKEGSTKQPSFGEAWTKKIDFCVAHAKEDMVDRKSKKCAQPVAPIWRRSVYWRPRKEISEPATPGRAGRSQRDKNCCAHAGRNKAPSFGVTRGMGLARIKRSNTSSSTTTRQLV